VERHAARLPLTDGDSPIEGRARADTAGTQCRRARTPERGGNVTRSIVRMVAALALVGVAFAQSDRQVARTFDEYLALNAGLQHYGPLHEEWVPAMGVHWGAPGPHVTLGVGHAGQVVVVEAIFPEAIGWQPWFDQPEGEPMELGPMGMVYTQHIWITDPASVTEGADPTFLPLTLAALTEANPAIAGYQQLSEYVPNMGYHYGMMGPGLVLAVSADGDINAFELIFPAADGHFPWFDQPEGAPMDMGPMGLVYTQHVYVVDPATLP